MSGTSYSLDELPKFSVWPRRLLGIEPWTTRNKTPAEVLREYEVDKWGDLLTKLGRGEITSLAQADRLFYAPDIRLPSCIGDDLLLLDMQEAHRRYLALLESVLDSLLPCTALVELGAGYGSQILALAKQPAFADAAIFAGEYTASGVTLIKAFAAREKVSIVAERCDFNGDPLAILPVPENAIIFTSMATHYVPMLSSKFFDSLCARRPKAVIHLEPCHEHCASDTLLGLMRRRYIEVNDYNTNLVSLAHQLAAQGRLEILSERPQLMGQNVLLPVSLLVWRPSLR